MPCVIGDLAEEQRALATLGRTYFVHSLAEDVGEEEARELRIHAGDANLKSLDVCDKLSGVVADRLAVCDALIEDKHLSNVKLV